MDEVLRTGGGGLLYWELERLTPLGPRHPNVAVDPISAHRKQVSVKHVKKLFVNFIADWENNWMIM